MFSDDCKLPTIDNAIMDTSTWRHAGSFTFAFIVVILELESGSWMNIMFLKVNQFAVAASF